ncbi:hypothetical protein PR003_g8207 [Phytophthora rubi]|uniref:Uncharacterized protein n=1 Tax=Phytophthora rubi TaxID=129364 RepID=A0A6A4FLY2_9STRA|nr:hypothetical protein PR003_g8207 [Phytophthora rubi]
MATPVMSASMAQHCTTLKRQCSSTNMSMAVVMILSWYTIW